MEIQAAIVLVLVFFLMLAMSVPVSFSIISASLLTIIMFLTPGFGMFVSAQKIVSGIDSFTLLARLLDQSRARVVPPADQRFGRGRQHGADDPFDLFVALGQRRPFQRV